MKNFEFTAVAKADPVLHQLHGTIYKADTIDTQGEFMSAAELTKAAHAALANGVAIDVNHSGQALAKQHAALVESTVQDGVWKGVVQLSKAAWDQLVTGGLAKAFSIGGSAPRRDVQKDGKPAREIYDAQVAFISLVPRGTNGEPAIQKSDEPPAWAKALMKQMEEIDAKIEETERKLAGVGTAGNRGSDALLKTAQAEQRARDHVKIAQLEKRHQVKARELERLWEQPGYETGAGEGRREHEQRLCRELAQIESELEVLGKSMAVDLDGKHSVFHFNGGRSYRLRASDVFGAGISDSAYEAKPESVSKAEDGNPIDDLII